MAEFKQLSPESINQFQEGILLTLKNWDALDAGLTNGFGSQAQVHNFASQIFNFFHQPNRKEIIYIDDLEQLLWDGMGSFGIVAEDGSIEEVAEDLMTMHIECLEGQYHSVQKLREQRGVLSSVVRQVISASDDDEDGDEDDETSDMMVDSQASLPTPSPSPMQKNGSSSQHVGVDEDGWVTVSSKKNRGRNH